jgi:ABC-type multidrug transport system fused ATPase/permease subunit
MKTSISAPYRASIAAGQSLGIGRRRAVVLLALQAGAILFESIGVTVLLPIVQFIQSNGDLDKLADTARYWVWIIDAHAFFGARVTLLGLLALSFLAILIRQGFMFLRTYIEGRMQETSVRAVRVKAFELFVHAVQASQDSAKLGEIVNDLVVEVPRAVSSVVCVVRVLGAVLLTASYIAILAMLSLWLTAAAIAVLGIGLLILSVPLGRSRTTSLNITDSNKQFASFLAERLQAGRLIRLSGSESAEVERIKILTWSQTKRTLHFHRLGAVIGTVMEPIAVGTGLALLYFGTQYLGVAIETIALFVLIMLRLLPAVTEAVRMHNVVLGFSGSLDSVRQRMTVLESAREPNSGRIECQGVRDRIALRNVSFSYIDGGAVPALRNVDLDIPSGKLTALVGPSGAGKSTLIDLLPRVRLPTGGEIYFDGQPLNDFTLSSLRRVIAFVPQVTQIFDVSVRDQIRYGNVEVDELAVRRAAELAGAAEFINGLSHGYDTMLGEAGYRLSGGQRQRLDIARALARRASIVILDEPTSQLDAETERTFRETLRRLRKETGLTIIVIAHRLSTIVDADQIVVLDSGRVAGVGAHDDLVRSCPWYAQAIASSSKVVPLASA